MNNWVFVLELSSQILFFFNYRFSLRSNSIYFSKWKIFLASFWSSKLIRLRLFCENLHSRPFIMLKVLCFLKCVKVKMLLNMGQTEEYKCLPTSVSFTNARKPCAKEFTWSIDWASEELCWNLSLHVLKQLEYDKT